MKKITLLLVLLITSIGLSQELITNGNFETDDETGWMGNAANVVTENNNSYNSANVETAGNAWDASLSQVVSITNGETYTLKFDAWSDRSRIIVAGIGLNQDPWSSVVETITLSSTSQSYTLTLTANFGNANSRVIFDMGAAIGFVGIDNVSLQVLDTEDDARLSDLQVDATTISGFSSEVTSYNYEAIAGGTVPTVTATASNVNAAITIQPATSIPGSTTIQVVSQNSNQTKTYTVSFVVVSAPTDAPNPPPTRNAWDVISLYGEAYGTEIGLANTTWDNGADSEELTIASNKVLKVTNGTDQFIGFDIANTDGFVNATDMTHFHADFWIVGDYITGQTLNPTLSNHAGVIGTQTNGIVLPKAIAGDGSENETWVSVDLEIGTDDRERIAQLLFTYSVADGATPDNIYFDNIYLYRAATAGVDLNNLLDVSLSPVPAKNELRISAQDLIENVTIYNILGKRVVNATINKKEDVLDVSSLKTGVYILKYTINNAVGTMKFIKE
ncbi:carbohydrate binding domain-containing protein [Polaribacter sp.]|nr:carbohydrate binding domain-containing protein [Polaribacter sp.]MDC1462371.1 carbohydrate binding domain-containing protein [Polaribacter sp.]